MDNGGSGKLTHTFLIPNAFESRKIICAGLEPSVADSCAERARGLFSPDPWLCHRLVANIPGLKRSIFIPSSDLLYSRGRFLLLDLDMMIKSEEEGVRYYIAGKDRNARLLDSCCEEYVESGGCIGQSGDFQLRRSTPAPSCRR